MIKNALNQIFLLDQIQDRTEYLNQMYVETTKRGNILAITISAIELLFIVRLLMLHGLPQHMPKIYQHYFYTYAFLILMMICIWQASAFLLSHPTYSYRLRRSATLMVCEGTVLPLIYISWLDQHHYGHISVYFCALVCVALYPLLEPLWSFAFLVVNQLIFSIGITYYQVDPEIALAHILNTIPFVVFMWLISRQFFKTKFHEYEDAHTIKMQQAELYRLYNEESLTDDLTSIGNRRFIRKNFEVMRQRCRREKTTLTAMFIDGDNLKSINDRYGHSHSDIFLKSIANALKQEEKRTNSIVGRIGGDEFMLLAQNMSEVEATITSEAIRSYVTNNTSFGVNESASVSIGVIAIPEHQIQDFDKLLTQVDQLMYRAKEKGKNQVVQLM